LSLFFSPNSSQTEVKLGVKTMYGGYPQQLLAPPIVTPLPPSGNSIAILLIIVRCFSSFVVIIHFDDDDLNVKMCFFTFRS